MHFVVTYIEIKIKQHDRFSADAGWRWGNGNAGRGTGIIPAGRVHGDTRETAASYFRRTSGRLGRGRSRDGDGGCGAVVATWGRDRDARNRECRNRGRAGGGDRSGRSGNCYCRGGGIIPPPVPGVMPEMDFVALSTAVPVAVTLAGGAVMVTAGAVL